MPRIYTRTGDGGETSLWRRSGTPRRVPKDDPRVEACGSLDELSASLGVVRAHLATGSLEDQILEAVQRDLYGLGADIATPDLAAAEFRITAGAVARLEREIDRLDAALPTLQRFILPAGDAATAHCHVARTVCRRAERRLATLRRASGDGGDGLRYLNRLADLLFVLARHLGHAAGVPESTV
jgi:cob(I)alamin adenosyltransferase